MKNHKTYLTTSTLLLAFGLSGCTYVSLTEAGAQVAQSNAQAMTNCTLVGDVSSQTKDTVILDRNTGKVKEELIVLARNRAADLGATDLVETGIERGSATFKAYRCN